MSTIRDQLGSKNMSKEVQTFMKKHEARETSRGNNNQRTQRARGNQQSRNDRRMSYFRDGFDHINLWAKGQTQLGRVLSMESSIDINLPGLGKFSSIFALWTYLTTKNRHSFLRTAPDYVLRDWLRSRADSDNIVDYENVRYICAAALVRFINRSEVVRNALIDSGDSPILSYIPHNNVRTTHPQADWWVPVVCLARALLIGQGRVSQLDMEDFKDTDRPDDEIFVIVDESSTSVIGNFRKEKVSDKKPRATKRETVERQEYTEAQIAARREKQKLEQMRHIERLTQELTYPENITTSVMYFSKAEDRNAFIGNVLKYCMEDVSARDFQDAVTVAAMEHGPGSEAAKLEKPFMAYIHQLGDKLYAVSTDVFANPYVESDASDNDRISAKAAEFADTVFPEGDASEVSPGGEDIRIPFGDQGSIGLSLTVVGTANANGVDAVDPITPAPEPASEAVTSTD